MINLIERNHILYLTQYYYHCNITLYIMKPENYFTNPHTIAQKQYEALRAFFIDKCSAQQAALKFGYTKRAFNSIVSDFRKKLAVGVKQNDPYFLVRRKGPKRKPDSSELADLIIEMRKKYYSLGEIKVVLDSKRYTVSEKYIHLVLKNHGFGRLPRRSQQAIRELEQPHIEAARSIPIDLNPETFHTDSAGILLFLPYIESCGIKQAVAESTYPKTGVIDRVSSILSFQALKLSNVRRYSSDDLWCMDRGSGLFAGLNVLPKAAWYSSYSHRVTRAMNLSFLKSLHSIWRERGLLTDTVNLDFVTIPYWGDDAHLENNWSGKRRHSLSSMLSVLAQDPDTGIIEYGDTNVRHENQYAVVLEFLDFYWADNPAGDDLKYLVFDSKFTNYQNLRRLEDNGIKFITIRRRGKNIVKQINAIPKHRWKTIRVMNADGKGRTLKIYEQTLILKGYDKEIRQIAVTGHGKLKPALVITNDFDVKVAGIIRKYSRRWLVEKSISEQTDFFHLNRVSSSMVIKVDFDLTMTILAHNLYRLLALDLKRYERFSDIRIFEKFVSNGGAIEIKEDKIHVKLKKKRDLPALLTAMGHYSNVKISWLNGMKIKYSGLSYS